MSLNYNFGFWQAIPFVSSTPAAFTGGRFVAGRNGSTNMVYSGNGDAWTASTANQVGNWYDAAWSPSLKIMVFMAEDDKISYSSNGIAWTASTNQGSLHHCVEWSPTLNMFAAGSNVAGAGIITSSNGLTWATQSVSWGANVAEDIVYSVEKSLFVAVGQGSKVFTSSNGTTWTSRTATGEWHAATYMPSLGIFGIASVTNVYATSSDGISWTTSTKTGNHRDLAWAPSISTLVSANYGGKLLYSTNGGVTFNTSTSVTGNWWRVRWAPEIGRFAAVLFPSTKIYWSTDGITWTASTTTLTSGTWASLVWCPGLGTDF